MIKKNKTFLADNFGHPNESNKSEQEDNSFYFAKDNFKWMLIGLVFIGLGFILMLGGDANTLDGKFDPNSWNDSIFSIRRIRIAPLLVIIGFAIEVFAILKRNK